MKFETVDERPESCAGPRIRASLKLWALKFAKIWLFFDRMRARKGVTLPNWPDWCYLPWVYVRDILRSYPSQGHGPHMTTVRTIGALAAWRATQGVYHFDETVLEAVYSSKITGKIPVEMLFRLPEWSCYILTPGKRVGGFPVDGFFASLDWDVGRARPELHLLVEHYDENEGACHVVSVPIGLSHGTVAEGLAELEQGVEGKGRGAEGEPVLSRDAIEVAPMVEPLVSLVLFLCAKASEIREGGGGPRLPSLPEAVKTQHKGPRMFAPDRPTVWEVGHRIGGAIRAAAARDDERPTAPGEATGRRLRPHIRVAHWQTYWAGSRKSETGQRRVARWIAPYGVNVDDPNDLVPTERKVGPLSEE